MTDAELQAIRVRVAASQTRKRPPLRMNFQLLYYDTQALLAEVERLRAELHACRHELTRRFDLCQRQADELTALRRQLTPAAGHPPPPVVD